MKFKRYSSIENSYRLKTVHHIMEECAGMNFVVQEKIHGSNFSIYTDGETIRYGKRSGLLGPDANFYSYQTLPLKELEEKAREIFRKAQAERPHEISQVSIHGEIFGGEYSHPDVEKVVGVKRVQKEVQYSPKIEFMAFDIKVDDEFVNMDEFFSLCHTTSMPYIPLLTTGTLEECLNYPNAFESTIPTLLGLPAIEDNVCEGVVIKPVHTTILGNGSRAVLKNKNEKFSEKRKALKVKKQKDPLPQHVMDMMSKASQYVTENRLKNVLSHLGEVKQNEFGKLLGHMSHDAIQDFMKENPDFEEMDKKERKEVTRYLNGIIGNLIRPNFANIVDGTY